jgi:tetratricopeptide (TPR) repeat protein
MPVSVEGLAAAIDSDARRSDEASDARIRVELATEASRDAEACMAREPLNAACLYGSALALGLEARAHPTRAGELLRSMLERLAGAEAADAGYDQAGPMRVRALVLIRAPGWPLGPGDPDAGLAAARRAAALQPDYPPNHLALAEALAKTGDANGARRSYEQARDLAQALPSSGDRDGWLREADQALHRN